MRLSLKNIGKISSASVEIHGITVIAGENNTGKSTVGRALFAVFNSFYHIQKQIEYERIQNIEKLISIIYSRLARRLIITRRNMDIAWTIVKHIEDYRNNAEAVKQVIINQILQYDESLEMDIHADYIEPLIMQILDALNVSDADIFQSILEKKLDAEFNGQVNNIFMDSPGEINLSVKDNEIMVIVEDNRVKPFTEKVDLQTEIIYIDDPFVLDEVRNTDAEDPWYADDCMGHREHLIKKLNRENRTNLIDEIVKDNKLQKIYSRLSSVCSGEIVKNKRSGFGYQRKNTDKVLDVKNLSAGLKTFAILKRLLLNNTIEYNGIIILDEPEIHLHPEWQLLFAELIVLIQKEFGIHILLNTHSPYFLRAIQVYSAKYGRAEQCKYYLSEMAGDQAGISDVTDCIEQIYVKLSRPLQKLEDERWMDD